MEILDQTLNWLGSFFGFRGESKQTLGKKQYSKKSSGDSLAKGFIKQGAESFLKTFDAYDSQYTKELSDLGTLPRAKTYFTSSPVTPPTGALNTFTGMNNPRIVSAVSALAQRGVLTDPNVNRLFGDAKETALTLRQGRKTQALGSSELKRSLT
tara:strand:- start:5483 stop:5944 length:462 start_codon:yes stop_codon:yes gene_type:complete